MSKNFKLEDSNYFNDLKFLEINDPEIQNKNNTSNNNKLKITNINYPSKISNNFSHKTFSKKNKKKYQSEKNPLNYNVSKTNIYTPNINSNYSSNNIKTNKTQNFQNKNFTNKNYQSQNFDHRNFLNPNLNNKNYQSQNFSNQNFSNQNFSNSNRDVPLQNFQRGKDISFNDIKDISLYDLGGDGVGKDEPLKKDVSLFDFKGGSGKDEPLNYGGNF